MAVQVADLTETIFIQHTFTDKELLDIARQMSRAETTLKEKADEMKSFMTAMKADIAAQEAIIHGCAAKLNMGWEERKVACALKYENGKAIYFDKDGVIIKERDMTESEQLHLTTNGKFTDAENVIREDSERLMDEEAEEEKEDEE